MYREDVILRIKPLLETHMEKQGFCIVDMRFYKDREHQLVLEILADRVEGGITMDECVRLNRELGDVIGTSGAISDNYILDISSPGVDRPLATMADFKRNIGREVRVFLRQSHEDKIEYCGDIEGISDTAVTINTGNKNIQIPLDKINKAKQVIS